ncbi:hypothetical protein F6Y04_04630 [Bacillus megaterium]|nr:hypothetical protein [Priestia megaterium]
MDISSKILSDFSSKRKRKEMSFIDFYKGFQGKKSSPYLHGMTQCHLLEVHVLTWLTLGNNIGNNKGRNENCV